MTDLRLADNLKLPRDSILLKKAILAKSGAGKSNTGAAYVEETLDNKIQVVILDPKGDWWGVKSSADGKSEGYPVLILGGDHGDIPLDPAGRILKPLLASYPKAVEKATLADMAGYTEGGGAFQNPLGRLRTLGLVDYPQKGLVRAEDILFPRSS